MIIFMCKVCKLHNTSRARGGCMKSVYTVGFRADGKYETNLVDVLAETMSEAEDKAKTVAAKLKMSEIVIVSIKSQGDSAVYFKEINKGSLD